MGNRFDSLATIRCHVCRRRVPLSGAPFRRRMDGRWAWCVYVPRHFRSFGKLCSNELEVLADAPDPSS